MRIFSKKSFAIGPGAQQGTSEVENFVTVPNTFQEMPDKYVNDPTFIAAVKAGEITVVTGVSVQKELENTPPAPVVDDKSHDDTMAAFRDELKLMNRDQLLDAAKLYGVEVGNNEKNSELRKRIYEAYKLKSAEATEE